MGWSLRRPLGWLAENNVGRVPILAGQPEKVVSGGWFTSEFLICGIDLYDWFVHIILHYSTCCPVHCITEWKWLDGEWFICALYQTSLLSRQLMIWPVVHPAEKVNWTRPIYNALCCALPGTTTLHCRTLIHSAEHYATLHYTAGQWPSKQSATGAQTSLNWEQMTTVLEPGPLKVHLTQDSVHYKWNTVDCT